MYKGFSLGLISNFVYLSTAFLGFEAIQVLSMKKENKQKEYEYESLSKKILGIFASSIGVSLFASGLAYPFDTIKKKIQVNSSFGFESKYLNNKECLKENIKDFKGLYRYSIYL